MRVSCGFMIRRVVHVLYIYLHIYVHAFQLAPLSQLRRFFFVRFSLRELFSFFWSMHPLRFFQSCFSFSGALERLRRERTADTSRRARSAARRWHLRFWSGWRTKPHGRRWGWWWGWGWWWWWGGSPPCGLNAWGRSDRIRPAVPFGGGNRSHSHSIPICHTSHSFPLCHTSHSLPYVTLSHSFPICHTCHSLPHISEILCF